MSSVASVINKNLCCEQIYTLILLRELFNYPERFSLLLPCNSSVCVCVCVMFLWASTAVLGSWECGEICCLLYWKESGKPTIELRNRRNKGRQWMSHQRYLDQFMTSFSAGHNCLLWIDTARKIISIGKTIANYWLVICVSVF